jgi:hypothetical protein
MKLLSPRVHGYLDYAMVATFVAAPFLLGFYDVLAPSIACYALAGGLLLVSLLTRYPLGAVPVMPFTVHGDLEFALAPLIAAMPWIAGFALRLPACVFFVASGVGLFLVWVVTDYGGAERRR